MKKLFVLLSFIALGLSAAYAQQGKQAIGLQFGYGTEIENFSIGAKYQYNITDPIRLEGAFNYFFEDHGLNLWDLNVNVQYMFPLASKFNVYPLAGVTLTHWSADDIDWDKNYVGVNLGAGMQYDITSNLAFQLDFKYQLIKDFDQGVFNFGLVYTF